MHFSLKFYNIFDVFKLTKDAGQLLNDITHNLVNIPRINNLQKLNYVLKEAYKLKFSTGFVFWYNPQTIC